MATHDAFITVSGTTVHAGTGPMNRYFNAFTTTSSGTPAAQQGGSVSYRMRGYDQNGAVNGYVFWTSTTVDDDASDYSGSAGPVVDIIVHKVVGT